MIRESYNRWIGKVLGGRGKIFLGISIEKNSFEVLWCVLRIVRSLLWLKVGWKRWEGMEWEWGWSDRRLVGEKFGFV